MSLKEKEIYKCEFCNKSFEIDIYQSINVTIDKELRKKVLNDEIYNYECPHCHKINKVIYTFLYDDLEHEFMVNTGSGESLLDFYYSFINDDCSYMVEFPEIKQKIRQFGATSYEDLISNIVLLENDLDPRIGAIYTFIERNQIQENFNKAKEEIIQKLRVEKCYFGYEDNKIVVKYRINNPVDNSYKIMSNNFDIKTYKELYVAFIDTVEEMYSYVFDENSVYKLFNIYSNNKIEYYQNKKITVGTMELEDGYYMPAIIPELYKENYKVDDYVITWEDETIKKGKITHIIDTNELYFPYSSQEMPTILYKVKDVELTTTKNSNDILENKEIKEMLEKHDLECLPDLFLSDIIIMLEARLKDDKFLFENNGEMPFDAISIKPKTIRIDDKNYLNVYLESSEIKNPDSNINIIKFEDAFKLVINNPSEFDGIVIDVQGNYLKLTHTYLIKLYMMVLAYNLDRTKQIIENLKEDEIKYFTEEEFNSLKERYIDRKECKENLQELNKAIIKLRDITLFNY